MEKLADLREPMPMPDPSFPVKVHDTRFYDNGAILFPHHWHEHIEFLFFTGGNATIECGTTPYACQAGDLAVVNSNELHYGVSKSPELLYYAMIVDISLLQSHSLDAVEKKFITPISQNRILFQNLIRNDAEINDCMYALVHELENKTIGFELSVKAHLYRLLSILIRKYVAEPTDYDAYDGRLRDLERLAPVFHHINEYYGDKLTVQELADLAGLSRFHFSRLFKKLTDKSLVEYINIIRIHKSESLLRQSPMNISEIAHATGFNDIYYFSRTFKRLKRISPTAWRDLQR